MAVTLFGGEKQRKEQAAQSYADKYPISNDSSQLQKTLSEAQIDLAQLKNEQPTTSGGKRIRQRNITALSNRIMQLQNKMKDINSGISSAYSGLTIAAPVFATMPKISTDTLTLKNNFNLPIPTLKVPSVDQQKQTMSGIYAGVAQPFKPEGQFADEAPKGAKGDYPPPMGVQGTKPSTYLMYGGLALGVGVLAYYMFKKD